MQFPHLADLAKEDIQDTHVLVRADFNVPIEDGEIDTDFRIKETLPTIRWLKERGAKIILCSHISGDELETLEVVYEYLADIFDSIAFVREYADDAAKEQIAAMDSGDIVLFENLRQYDEEKANADVFAKQLASYADLYVNEAFASSHRAHASIVGVPEYLPAYAGLQFVDEVQHLSHAHAPEHPFLFILGGAKFATKIPLIRSFVDRADTIYVAGALANVFFQAKGREVGRSLLPDQEVKVDDLLDSENIVLPADLRVVDEDDDHCVTAVDDIGSGEKQLDIGPDSMDELEAHIQESDFIVWNGPLGDYEQGYGETTDECAKLIAERDTTAIVGGGDTVAAIADMDIEHMFTFVSTAGGAMVDFLADETLPGIEALADASARNQ